LNQTFASCRFADRCADVMARCRQSVPALLEPEPGHAVRCFLYQDAPVGVQPRLTRAVDSASVADRPAGSTLLELRDYRVWFPIRKGVLQRTVDHVKAVDGVSFSIAAGRTLALVGESGSGKTTVGKALLQLLRQQAQIGGQALLNGQSLGDMHGEVLRHARRSVQIVFQDPFASLNPRMRVSEILEEGVISLRPDVSATERSARVARLLDKVGLPTAALQRYPHEFSGGQRQRLAIARALAVEPALIVADEPTSALDVSVQAQILNLFRQLQQELGVAYLFITHNFGVVEYLAHDIAVMKDGQLVEYGSARQVLEQPSHGYTQTLLKAVPRLRLATSAMA
jgi:peptide/nickel transport system ATP-binding protein